MTRVVAFCAGCDAVILEGNVAVVQHNRWWCAWCGFRKIVDTCVPRHGIAQ